MKKIKTMKYRYIFLLFAVLSITGFSTAQNIKMKKNEVNVNDAPLCKIEDDKVNQWAFYIVTNTGEKALYFKWIEWGQAGYLEAYKASDLGTILFEIEAVTGYKKYIIEKLYTSGVITTTGIDETKLKDFSAKTGKEYTRMREKK